MCALRSSHNASPRQISGMASQIVGNWSTGDRVVLVGGRSHVGMGATVLGYASAKGCVTLNIDGDANNGAGLQACRPPADLRRRSHRLSVQRLLRRSGERASIPRPAVSPMRRLPLHTGETWSRGLRLPTYVLPTLRGEAGNTSLQLGRRGAGGRAPILPTLFLPGFPKSATTWLYSCLADAFTPSKAGCALAQLSPLKPAAPSRRHPETPSSPARAASTAPSLMPPIELPRTPFLAGAARTPRSGTRARASAASCSLPSQ